MAWNERSLDKEQSVVPATESWAERFIQEQQTSSLNRTASADAQNRPAIPPGRVYDDFDPNKWMTDLDANGDKHITRQEVAKFDNDTFSKGSMHIKDFERSSALLYNLDLIQQLSDDDQGPEIGVTINDLKRLSELSKQPANNDNERYLARLYKVDK